MIAFREMLDSDWEAVADIYRQGIETGNATFRQEVPSWEYWNDAYSKKCRIVAIENGEVVGWTAILPVSTRCVYGGVNEVSIYISLDHTGKNIGTRLLEELVKQSEENGIWTLQSGIFQENTGSIKIHEKNGFKTIGIREKIGKMNGRWRDVILMERRSQSVGIN